MLKAALFLLCTLIIASLLAFYLVTQRKTTNGGRTLLVSLGSGGHTTEMLLMLENVDLTPFPRRVYYVSSGDTLSLQKARSFEEKHNQPGASFSVIARARRVKQSWWTTPYSSLWSIMHALQLVYEDAPDVIMVNGPGTCVLIVLASRILSVLKCTSRARIIFIESFARVKTLSLSGKILLKLRLTDRFLVMWEDLTPLSDRIEYVGLII